MPFSAPQDTKKQKNHEAGPVAGWLVVLRFCLEFRRSGVIVGSGGQDFFVDPGGMYHWLDGAGFR